MRKGRTKDVFQTSVKVSKKEDAKKCGLSVVVMSRSGEILRQCESYH